MGTGVTLPLLPPGNLLGDRRLNRPPGRVGDRCQADHRDTWLSGVRQGGAQLSATPHRPADRPELSVGTHLLVPTDSSTLSAGTPWRRSLDLVKERTRPPLPSAASAKSRRSSPHFPGERRRTTEYPTNGSSSRPHLATCSRGSSSDPRNKRIMVKPHGLLVPVSLTPRGASTPGLSTWSSTRSLQRSCDLGDLILWRVSRLDAFSISPIRT